MKYFRLYSDEEGESHVEQIDVEFDMQEYAPPAPAFGISAPKDVARYIMVHFPADWDSEFHPSPRRQLFVMLSGDFEGKASDGTVMNLTAGDVLLMEDTSGKGHTLTALNGKEVYAMMIHLE